MAEEQKPIAVPETAPVVVEPVAEPVVETKPAEDKVVEETPAVEAAAETKTEETGAAPVEETKKEEVKPIEAGTLEHKGAPANFPKYVSTTGPISSFISSTLPNHISAGIYYMPRTTSGLEVMLSRRRSFLPI